MPAPAPPGWTTLTPRLITSDVEGLVGFVKAVFEAEGELKAGRPTELRIGDAMLMVSDGGGVREAMGAFLYVHVADVDAVHERAVAAGAETVEAPCETPYGDRRATVSDKWGNLWQVAAYNGAAGQ